MVKVETLYIRTRIAHTKIILTQLCKLYSIRMTIILDHLYINGAIRKNAQVPSQPIFEIS